MGRKRLYPVETVEKPQLSDSRSVNLIKNRHRFADTKYRHNVQFLFDILRGPFKENLSKDDLLKKVFENIIEMENNINSAIGPSKVSECKQEFVNLLELEEHIWKREKIPVIWWTKMRGIFDDIMDLEKASLDFSSAISKHSLNNGLIAKKETFKKPPKYNSSASKKFKKSPKVPKDKGTLTSDDFCYKNFKISSSFEVDISAHVDENFVKP